MLFQVRMLNMLKLSAHLKQHLPSEGAFEALLRVKGQVYREVKHRKTVGFQLGGKRYFIKIHYGCGWREILKELLQGRTPVLSAQREWEAISRLQALGIRTANVVGKGRRGWNPARIDSFVVMEALEGMVTLEDLTADGGGLQGPRQVLLKRNLITQLADITRTLHANGFNHRDYYLCHFMILDRCWGKWQGTDPLELYLIDLHRIQSRRKVPQRWLVKDLGGLLFSALDCGLTSRDILRFVRRYRRQPWRQCLEQGPMFWKKVLRRARRLYRSAHEKEPRFPGWFANFA